LYRSKRNTIKNIQVHPEFVGAASLKEKPGVYLLTNQLRQSSTPEPVEEISCLYPEIQYSILSEVSTDDSEARSR
jgi:hypothetical protein